MSEVLSRVYLEVTMSACHTHNNLYCVFARHYSDKQHIFKLLNASGIPSYLDLLIAEGYDSIEALRGVLQRSAPPPGSN